MIPRTSKLGSSFKSCGLYYLHDKDASTSERVAFTHTENVPTQDPEKALKWMAFTAIHAEELKRENGSPGTGQRCQKPVFTMSLSWHPEQEPKKWDMIRAGRRALAALGLAEHETLMVSHNETEHPHLHLIVNTVHPETGKVNSLSHSRLKLSKWAEEYEKEHGKIYCDKRVENNEKRDQGEYVKYEEPQPEIDHKARIAALYHSSDSGKAFQQALAQAGYKLAQGNRIVVIDKAGNLYSLSRQIDDVKAKDIRAKLADLELPTIDETGRSETSQNEAASAKPKPEPKKPQLPENDERAEAAAQPDTEYVDRDQQDRDWQESIIDAGIAASADKSPKPKPGTSEPANTAEIPSSLLNRQQHRHLAELGQFYESSAQARHRVSARIESQYGPHERELRDSAAHLQQILSNSGRVRVWWLKFTRQIPKDAEDQLQNMQKTLADIEWRKAEAQQAVEASIARQRYAIEQRQLRERTEIDLSLKYQHTALREDSDHEPGAELGPTFDY